MKSKSKKTLPWSIFTPGSVTLPFGKGKKTRPKLQIRAHRSPAKLWHLGRTLQRELDRICTITELSQSTKWVYTPLQPSSVPESADGNSSNCTMSVLHLMDGAWAQLSHGTRTSLYPHWLRRGVYLKIGIVHTLEK